MRYELTETVNDFLHVMDTNTGDCVAAFAAELGDKRGMLAGMVCEALNAQETTALVKDLRTELGGVLMKLKLALDCLGVKEALENYGYELPIEGSFDGVGSVLQAADDYLAMRGVR